MSNMACEDKNNLMMRLDTIKEIRGRSLNLEKVKAKLLQDLQLIASEDKHIRKYQLELDGLKRERQAHTETLAALATDIDLMEATIKGSQNARRKISELVSNILQSEYQPLKDEIDYYRSLIGLDKLPEFPDEYKRFSSVIDPSTFPVTTKPNGRSSENINCAHTSESNCWQRKDTQPCSSSRRRQSQPPMKQCEACRQMIHRNAPVCPLCKAKSHSKHPKKSRKKAN